MKCNSLWNLNHTEDASISFSLKKGRFIYCRYVQLLIGRDGSLSLSLFCGSLSPCQFVRTCVCVWDGVELKKGGKVWMYLWASWRKIVERKKNEFLWLLLLFKVREMKWGIFKKWQPASNWMDGGKLFFWFSLSVFFYFEKTRYAYLTFLHNMIVIWSQTTIFQTYCGIDWSWIEWTIVFGTS